MSKRSGYAALAALVSAVVLICGGIYLGVGAVKAKPAVRKPPAATPLWIGTWAASPVGIAPVATVAGAPSGSHGRSVRNVVHTSIGGTAARVTVSNLYGTLPLRISAVSLAVRAGDDGPEAVRGTLRPVTFGRATGATVAPGGQLVSDPVVLRIPYDGDLLVTVHTPAPGGVTSHTHARQTSYVAEGDHTRDEAGDAYRTETRSWHHVTAVDVLTAEARGAVVAVGDSITDGVSSTPDTNRRWPDVLADRLAGRYGVLNEGISGNRLLSQDRGPSTLDRFDRDVLSRSGARTVIVAIGINDLLRAPYTPPGDGVVTGLTELSRRARAQGLRVIGATLMPCGGHLRCTPAVEAERLEVNAAIRAGGIFDAVVDFDRALRDPYAPQRLRPVYDSGDHLHPSDAGYARMGASVDVKAL
ncbi:SGNH/GDSL hydrolase family protein [Streptomyces sp. PKU-EA00015]|uniref:SGNH/GDSL hydrolase family protein n=1 Tax=Streptomyces sp. PKU-EA00015 TaxID=2748326 RepID=UPI0015A1D84B|nr:SGNH/GDSL hydrolase family protein [Streptomyces sp. PKU-EA00015]NWF30078.1 SGNH/GDSL hydrolase family protein [Streptomyces sp. PKU-EA00015]